MMAELNKLYFPDDPENLIGEHNLMTGFKDAVGDAIFTVIGSVTARAIAEKSSAPVYEYLYSHKGTSGLLTLQLIKPWQFFLKVSSSIF